MRLPIQVAVYIARKSLPGWGFLLLKRLPSKLGFWQGVTGGVEEGETIPQAAKREFAEETGLKPLLFESIDYSYTFPLEGKWEDLYEAGTKTVDEYVFVAVVDSNINPVLCTQEHDRFRWCDYDKAIKLLHWNSNKESLTLCRDYLDKHHSL